MRIAGLVERIDHVCTRYRLRAFVPAFAAAGHDLELLEIPRGPFSQFQFFRSLVRFDAVILQRHLIPRISTTLLRTFAKRLIFDIDDAVWLRDSYHARGPHSRKRLGRFRAIVAASDAVVCGNDFLADFADRIAPGRAVVIPTCVDAAAYHPRPKTGNAVTLVWVGSKSTLQGLEQSRWHLEAIGRAIPEAKLRIVSDASLSLESLPVEFIPWTAAGEIDAIATADVGIARMPDDDWSRGKCGLKVVQYLAAGLPVIANPVGVHEEMVRAGETGYLVDTAADWIEAIRMLAEPALRNRLGANARRMAEQEYSIAANAPKWLSVVERVAMVNRRAG